jgi:hypothetical protein
MGWETYEPFFFLRLVEEVLWTSAVLILMPVVIWMVGEAEMKGVAYYESSFGPALPRKLRQV